MTERNENWRDPDNTSTDGTDPNRDPITGTPGAHPAGTGVGATAGGLAGAVAGAAIGSIVPGAGTVIGGVIGTVVGAVAGGLAGKGVAESVNPTDEDTYWREAYKTRPYYESGRSYEDYRPAYEHGWESRGRHAGKKFEDVEADLRKEWEERGRKDYSWDQARHATRDAWDRLDQSAASGTSSAASSGSTPVAGGSAAVYGTDAARDQGLGSDAARDTNPDPITGASGSHPIGAGIGAAGGGLGGAAAGAAIGTAVAPGVGTVVGGIAGAVAGGVGGGYAGKGVAEAIDPTEEEAHWRTNYVSRPYYSAEYNYDDDYLPAYRYGWQSRGRYHGRNFDEVESDLGRDWNNFKGKSRMNWEKATHAARDAWHRVERKLPGDADRDGR